MYDTKFEKESLKKLAVLFNQSPEELVGRIAETKGNEWVKDTSIVIVPCSHADDKDAYESLSLGIYMDSAKDIYGDAVPEGFPEFFPDPQIDVWDYHENMHEDDGTYICFFEDLWSSQLYDFILENQNENQFLIMTNGKKSEKKVSFMELKDAIDDYYETKDAEVLAAFLHDTDKTIVMDDIEKE